MAVEVTPAPIGQIACVVREILLTEFGSTHGCCQRASVMLWVLLAESGLNATVMNGTASGHEHMWLEVHGHLLDVTLDQFTLDSQPPGIVWLPVADARIQWRYEGRCFTVDRTHRQAQHARLALARHILK